MGRNAAIKLDSSRPGINLQCIGCSSYLGFENHDCKQFSDIPYDIWIAKKRCPHAEYTSKEQEDKVNLLFKSK